MLLHFRLPKTLLWVFNLLIIFLLMFTLYRFITFVAFKPEGKLLSDHFSSFLLGIRFDLRWISIILLPIIIASLIPQFSPFFSNRTRKIWTWYLAVVTFIVIFFFAADFGCFSYNKTRLNASALNFAEDPKTSMMMLWQSYPMFWLLLALLVAVLALKWMFRKTHLYVISKTDGKGIPYRRHWFVTAAFLLGFMIYGAVSSQPLKWNNAFQLNDGFKSYLALNPMQNFFTTLKFRKPQFNEGQAKEY